MVKCILTKCELTIVEKRCGRRRKLMYIDLYTMSALLPKRQKSKIQIRSRVYILSKHGKRKLHLNLD